MNHNSPDNPEITVLMSVFNGEAWLEEAISSVLCQTFTGFEFIIVDDGSTDNTPNIVSRYQQLDSRIIVITKRNTGLADSLNCGIQKARGKWIARLDADDVCVADRLEKQLKLAGSNPSLIYVGSGAEIIDTNGQVVSTYTYPTGSYRLKRNLQKRKKFPPHSSALYLTDAVRSVGGYRSRIAKAEDIDLWLRLSEIGEIGSIEQPLVKIRKHPGQITAHENGYQSKLDGLVAATSFWIRRMGHDDPVSEENAAFPKFRDWVAIRFSEERVMDQFELIRRLKAARAHSHQPWTAMKTFVQLLNEDWSLSAKVLQKKLFGDKLAKSLAVEWCGKIVE